MDLDPLTFNAFKGVVGFNSRFTQGVVGERNLLDFESAVEVGVEDLVVVEGEAGEVGVGGEGKAELYEGSYDDGEEGMVDLYESSYDDDF